MISRNLYLNILVRILLMIALSMIVGWAVTSGKSARITIIAILVLIALTVSLVTYLNSTNRKIKYFFDAVRNDDSSLSFPDDGKNRTISEIQKSMNRVNQQIKQLKIEIRTQEQYFSTLIEHLATGIIIYNKQGFILHSNSAARRLLATEVLTHTEQITRIDLKLYQAIKGMKPFERRLVNLSTEMGEIQLSLKTASFRTNNDDVSILSIQDIKNELDEKEVESWMKLIRILMHEIMNSITPITSLSESLTGLFTDNGKPVGPDALSESSISTTIQGLGVIRQQGRGLMSFVESYRKLTRVPEPSKEIFKASELLDRVKTLYSSIEKSELLSLSVSEMEPGLEIYADKNLICQVLINLIRNAIEANEGNQKGLISIVAARDQNQRPEICVTDNGPGIPAENIDQIFVPFFTTRQNGSGIGLSISRHIMKIHGGNLKVRSVVGKETVFCLSF